MGAIAGLHWGTNGWIGFTHRDGNWAYDCYPTIASVWEELEDWDLLLVTVPVGLPTAESGRRTCDEAAKRLLGPRRQQVYYAPVRAAVYETSLSAAKEHNADAGFGIQNQAWVGVPRIREVDEFLARTPEAREHVRETNPAVCFHALAGGALAHERTDDHGRKERVAILEDAAPDLVEAVEEAVAGLTQPRYAPLVTDPADVIDAAVAGVTARRHPDLPTLPMTPPTDERGLSMGIVYPGDARQLTLGDIGDARS